MKNLIIAFLLVGALTIHSKVLYSNEVDEINEIDEIIVNSSYIDTNLSDLDDPIHVIAGDDVIFDSTLSLGESLDSLLGVQSSDFGSAVGHPVIRGLSGSRVKKMNNGRTLRDVSSVGDDHMNEVDLNDIQQIEIVRGPSSLLYSSGTVGGIINIIDNTIAREDFEKMNLNIGLETQSVNDGEAGSLSYQNNVGGFNLSFAIKDSQFDNFDIPNGAILHSEEEHHDEDEHHDEEHEEEIDYFNKDFSKTSFALGLSREINDNLTIGVGFSRVERAPSATELFMNGPHLVTGRYEVGNTNLKSETANNIDLNVFYKNNNFSFRANIFTNNIDNYIYLKDESEEEHDEHEEEHDDHGGLILANYLQRDAELEGYELEVSQLFEFDRGNLTLSLGRDSVSGEFSNGTNIPRIVPARNILTLSYSEDNLSARLTYKDVEKQNDIGEGEVMTEAYEMLDFSLRKSFTLSNQSQISLSLFGKNLLDEVARNHSSFVKNEVPLPGRNFGIKLNYNF